MLKFFFLLPGLTAILLAQIGDFRNPVPQSLVQYLELTTEQVNTIGRLNSDLSQYNAQKFTRSAQVYAELAQENAKPTPDPMAIGLRYVELESIRREITAEREKTMNAIQNALTAPQKVRLTTLQEALRVYPTACNAVNHNLLAAPALTVGGVISATPIPSSIIGGLISPGCGSFGVRAGDFTLTPNPFFGPAASDATR